MLKSAISLVKSWTFIVVLLVPQALYLQSFLFRPPKIYSSPDIDFANSFLLYLFHPFNPFFSIISIYIYIPNISRSLACFTPYFAIFSLSKSSWTSEGGPRGLGRGGPWPGLPGALGAADLWPGELLRVSRGEEEPVGYEAFGTIKIRKCGKLILMVPNVILMGY